MHILALSATGPRVTSIAARRNRLLLRLAFGACAALLCLGALQPAQAMPGGVQGGPGAAMFAGGPRHLERMLDSVQATPEQRVQLQQIFGAARADLKAQHEQGRALREQVRALWVQPTVDARAAEGLRQQLQAQHDAASKRGMQAMLEASRVLTPAQRQQLAQQAAERSARWERSEHGERGMHRLRERREGVPGDAPR
jgi:protein CpxP